MNVAFLFMGLSMTLKLYLEKPQHYLSLSRLQSPDYLISEVCINLGNKGGPINKSRDCNLGQVWWTLTLQVSKFINHNYPQSLNNSNKSWWNTLKPLEFNKICVKLIIEQPPIPQAIQGVQQNLETPNISGSVYTVVVYWGFSGHGSIFRYCPVNLIFIQICLND